MLKGTCDKSSSTGTKASFHNKSKNFLSAGRLLGSLRVKKKKALVSLKKKKKKYHLFVCFHLLSSVGMQTGSAEKFAHVCSCIVNKVSHYHSGGFLWKVRCVFRVSDPFTGKRTEANELAGDVLHLLQVALPCP